MGDAAEVKEMHEAPDSVLLANPPATQQDLFHGDPPAVAHRGKLPSSYFDENAWRVVSDRYDLSGRQLDVLRCLFDGTDRITTAERLGLSAHTVHTHVGRLFRKFHVNSRCGLMVRLFLVLLSPGDRLIYRTDDGNHKQDVIL